MATRYAVADPNRTRRGLRDTYDVINTTTGQVVASFFYLAQAKDHAAAHNRAARATARYIQRGK
jgi:hypothetical protein